MTVTPLAWATPPEWVAAVATDTLSLLSDHAHCELKAASSAQALIAKNTLFASSRGGSPTALLECTATLLSTPDIRRTLNSLGVSLKLGSLYATRRLAPPLCSGARLIWF